MVEQMLLESNNVIAENLARHVALATGRPASFAGGAAAGSTAFGSWTAAGPAGEAATVGPAETAAWAAVATPPGRAGQNPKAVARRAARAGRSFMVMAASRIASL